MVVTQLVPFPARGSSYVHKITPSGGGWGSGDEWVSVGDNTNDAMSRSMDPSRIQNKAIRWRVEVGEKWDSDGGVTNSAISRHVQGKER